MAEENTKGNNIYSANDALDINELASLNDDISPEFIEQLQNQVAKEASEFTGKPFQSKVEDSELFEEVEKTTNSPQINSNIDDNFIKKYKAKLEKQANGNTNTTNKTQEESSSTQKENTVQAVKTENVPDNTPIETLTSGNIIEKPIVKEQVEYNESLDFIDGNVKYSKYVIYIDPENTEFMESLTVKERKNLINRIIREQDDIAITKRRLGLIQTIIKHSVIAIITLAISIPVIYWTINASLEASINNYRRSKTVFKSLYKEKGKIKKSSISY